MKKTKYVGFRISMDEFARLELVREHIATCARGQKPEVADILRSILGWGNPDLVTQAERDYIAGKISVLPGDPTKGDNDPDRIILASGKPLGQGRRGR